MQLILLIFWLKSIPQSKIPSFLLGNQCGTSCIHCIKEQFVNCPQKDRGPPTPEYYSIQCVKLFPLGNNKELIRSELKLFELFNVNICLNLLNVCALLVSLRDAGHKCPVDNEILLETQLFPDNFAKREILSLMVKCPNGGCLHKMELRHLEVLKSRLAISIRIRQSLGNTDFAVSICVLPVPGI